MAGLVFPSQVLASQKAAGTSFGSYTTAKSVINQTELVPLPANTLNVGSMFRITVAGGLGSLVTTPGTVTMQVMLGSIAVFTTGAIQLNATAHTNLPFWLDVLLRVDTIGTGTTAKMMGMGRLQGIQPTLTAGQTDAANTGGIFSAPATAPAVGTGFDSTIATTLDFFVGFSISDAANTVRVQHYVVEMLGT